jgi:Cysteine rich repeat
MLQKSVRYNATAAINPAWLLSVAILISAVHYNVAQAQGHPRKNRTAISCGQQLQNQCSGVPVHANNMLECLQKSQGLSARCAALAHHVVRSCDRDAAQFCHEVVAGQGNILGCLRASSAVVSSRCHAALNAAFLRQ